MNVKIVSDPSRAPFSMLETRMWTDEKFVKLSRIPPCGQGLWVYLLTGPHTVQTRAVPGVYVVSRAAIAEALGWTIEEFDSVFSPIFRHKMAIPDWEHQILWLPNVLKRHMPRSPHNVLSWRVGWELIPDCALKRRIYDAIKPVIFAKGEAFAKAFDDAVKPVAHGFAGGGTKRAKREPSASGRSDHKSKDGLASAAQKTGPSASGRSDHKSKHGGTMNGKKVGPYTDVDRDVDKPQNPKSVNGATAPLPSRTRVREHSDNPKTAQSPPGKAQSEFASVLRAKASVQREHRQRDLLDDDGGKPAPDKASTGHGGDHNSQHGPTIATNMVEPSHGHANRKPASAKASGPDTRPTWEAFSAKYVARYGVEPVRNASVNAQMLHFVGRVGAADAPAVAAFYVESCASAIYVKRCHAVGMLLQDAEALHTQWAMRRPVTATEAAMADRTATNANAFGPLIAEARERERNEAGHGRK